MYAYVVNVKSEITKDSKSTESLEEFVLVRSAQYFLIVFSKFSRYQLKVFAIK